MTALAAEFLHAAATYEPPKETRWMWCQCHGQRTDFVRVDETRWRCPDCGRAVTIDTRANGSTIVS